MTAPAIERIEEAVSDRWLAGCSSDQFGNIRLQVLEDRVGPAEDRVLAARVLTLRCQTLSIANRRAVVRCSCICLPVHDQRVTSVAVDVLVADVEGLRSFFNWRHSSEGNRFRRASECLEHGSRRFLQAARSATVDGVVGGGLKRVA